MMDSDSKKVFSYCLTTEGADAHSTATLISALSVRRQHPDARIVILTDNESAKNLRDCEHPLLKTANEIIAIPTPSGPAGLRNRFVKTQQRQLIAGDFLYLDADTVVVAPLDELFQVSAPFAAAPNHNSPRAIDTTFADELDVFRAHGWEIPSSAYVNGGVLFFRDTPETHAFGEMWHRKWQEASRGGKHYDQPALNSALWDSGLAYDVLPHRFNAQVHVRPRTAIAANVWHIYAALQSDLAPKTELNSLIARGLERGAVTPEDVDSLCRKPHPWTVSNPVDALVVKTMLKRWDFLPVEAFERKWLAGQRGSACVGFVKPPFSRMKSLCTAMLASA